MGSIGFSNIGYPGFLVWCFTIINTALCFVLDKSWAIILSTLIGAFIGVFIVEDKELENGDDEEVSV